MATEVGSGYVSLIPSAKGFGPAVASLISGPVEQAAAETGTKAGSSLQSGLLASAGGIGGKLVGALGFASIGVAAFKSAVDVEDAQNIIIRSTGATGKAADSLEQSFKNVASSSPASFDTIAQALSTVYQRTGLTGKGLETLTAQVVTFNRITKDSPLDVAQLTQALAGFNVPASEMGKTLDQLFVTSQHTGVPLSDLVSTLVTAGPVARQFGFSISFTAGLLAQLNKAGVDTNSIMPGLRKAFIEFAKAGEDPATALRDTLGQMDALLKKGDEAGARQLAVQLFGARGVGLVDAAISGKLSLQDLSKTFDSTGKGILDTASNTGTLSAMLGILKNQATLAFASFATPLLKSATDGLGDLVPIASALGGALQKIQPALEPVVLGFVALKIVGGAATAVQAFAVELGLVPGVALSAAAAETALAGASELTAEAMLAEASAATAQTAATATLSGSALPGAIVGFGVYELTLKGLAAAHELVHGADHTAEDTLKDSEAAAKAAVNAKNLVLAFQDVIAAQATDTGPSGLALQLQAFRDIGEQDIGTAARLADQFPKTSATYRGMQQILLELSGAQRQTNADQQQASLIEQGYSTDTANLKQALSDLQSVVLAASGGQVGYQQAVVNVQKAQQALNDAIGQYGPDSDQARDAQLNLASAQNQAAGATLGLDQAQAALQAKYKDSSSVDAAIAQLQQQQQEYPATADSLNPLIGQLLALKAKYDAIPPTKNTDVTATDNASPVLDVILGKLGGIIEGANAIVGDAGPVADAARRLHLPGFAAGGRPQVGEAQVVGEKGWELFVPDAPGTILPHDQSVMALARMQPAQGSSSTDSAVPLIGQVVYQGEVNDPVKNATHLARDLRVRQMLVRR